MSIQFMPLVPRAPTRTFDLGEKNQRLAAAIEGLPNAFTGFGGTPLSDKHIPGKLVGLDKHGQRAEIDSARNSLLGEMFIWFAKLFTAVTLIRPVSAPHEGGESAAQPRRVEGGA